jgi:hypothetical protein
MTEWTVVGSHPAVLVTTTGEELPIFRVVFQKGEDEFYYEIRLDLETPHWVHCGGSLCQEFIKGSEA